MMINHKHIKKNYVIVVVLILCWAGGVVYFHNVNKHTKKSEPVVYSSEHERTKIYGFKTDITDDNKKILTIKGDSFTVEKKKIGFLRTSLFNEAKIKNGEIHLYSSIITNSVDKQSGEKISFKNAITEDTLSSVYDKKISSIIVTPVSINLYQDNTLITRVTALSCRVRGMQKDILFSGKVTVESGTSTLITESLSFNPDNATFYTNATYKLIKDKESFKGQRFQSDIYLKSVPVENKM